MNKRSMKLVLGGKVFYASSFDPTTGALVRIAASDPDGKERDLYEKFSPGRRGVCSPVPETLDVCITRRCAIGCPGCYQDSLPGDPHADPRLIEKVMEGFDEPPYQIALGGGDPCQHPDLPGILKYIREKGTVPSYTTAGHVLTDSIAEATNKYAGSVAITYHAFRGLDVFLKQWRAWREKVTARTVIHVICNDDVATNLYHLAQHEEELGGPQTVVLLAYYTEVGRAGAAGYMTKKTYNQDFPAILRKLQAKGWRFAYSEGMLPYFLSRPELGVGSPLHTRNEGIFSGYVDDQGRMWTSSFEADLPQRATKNSLIELTPKVKTVFNTRAQKLWQKLKVWSHTPGTGVCGYCPHQDRCHAPQDNHYLACARQPHNRR